MSAGKIGLLVLVAVTMASGQILFKLAARTLAQPITFSVHSALQLALNPYLLAGIGVYGATTIMWVLLLRDTDLNKAYLVVALSLIIVPLAGTFLFHEPFTLRILAGMAIILLGLAVALW